MADAADSRILIAGAGIAGLTAAIALARAGFAITLIERATRFEEIGAGLQLSPNASRVLLELGLGPAIARHATPPRWLAIHRLDSSRILARMPMDEARDRFGAPFWTILRADLQTVLIDAARADARIAFLVGRTLEGVSETAGGVAVRVATGRGAETIEGAALIGADGLWSRARSLVGEMQTPRFAGHEAWRALVPADQALSTLSSDLLPRHGRAWPGHPRIVSPTEKVVDARPEAGHDGLVIGAAEAEEPMTHLWMGRRAHLVHYPVAAGRFINIVLTRAADRPREDTARGGWNAPGDAAGLSHLTRAMAAPARDLVASVPEWQVWSLYDCAPLARFARGRIALIGDAAHPVLPFLAQGAALAIEDAAVLAQEAARSPDNLAAAFRRFDARRRDRAARVQATSRTNGKTYHAGGLVAWARDRVISRLGETGMLKRYHWLYGWTQDA